MGNQNIIIQNGDSFEVTIVDNNNTFDVALVNVGPTGATGPKGEQGNQGFQGIPGPQGNQGLRGLQGLAGPKGDKGDKGDKGERGEGIEYSDLTPEELASITGPQGIQGLTGPKGDKGDKGERGEGIQGLTGPKGDTGAQGLIGPKGDTGIQGIQGIQGIAGPKGDTGSVGPAGEKGDKGDPGPAGQAVNLTPENIRDTLGYVPANDAGVISHIGNSDIHITLEEKSSFSSPKSGNSIVSINDMHNKAPLWYYLNKGRQNHWENWKELEMGIPGAGVSDWCGGITIVPYRVALEDKLTQIAYTLRGIYTRLSVGDDEYTATWGSWSKLATTGDVNAVSQQLATHVNDAGKHLQAGERNDWNSKIGNVSLPIGADLNNVKKAGVYFGYNLINAPDNGIYTMQVLEYSADWVTQLAFYPGYGMYVRYFYNGITWSNWETISGAANSPNLTWYNATLINGFTGEVRYAKNGYGTIFIEVNIIKLPTTAPGITVTTLPIGFKPSRSFPIPVTQTNLTPFSNNMPFVVTPQGNIGVSYDNKLAGVSDSAGLVGGVVYHAYS